jgi:hypothetical protein
VTVKIAIGPTKLAKPTRPRGEKHTQDELKFKELVTIVYGEHAGHYAEGEWTEGATELVQSEGWVSKHKEMATLIQKVRSSRQPLLARAHLSLLVACCLLYSLFT